MKRLKPEEPKDKFWIKFIFAVIFTGIVIGGSIVAIYTYFAVAPYNILKINNNPVPVESKTIKAGEVQVVDINYCKNLNIRGSVTWSLVSRTKVVLLPPYRDTAEIACGNLRAPIIIPVVSPDSYYLTWKVDYPVNPIRTVTIQFKSQPFKIINN